MVPLLHENCPALFAIYSFFNPKSGSYSMQGLEMADVAGLATPPDIEALYLGVFQLVQFVKSLKEPSQSLSHDAGPD
jgi:hypothetical protein